MDVLFVFLSFLLTIFWFFGKSRMNLNFLKMERHTTQLSNKLTSISCPQTLKSALVDAHHSDFATGRDGQFHKTDEFNNDYFPELCGDIRKIACLCASSASNENTTFLGVVLETFNRIEEVIGKTDEGCFYSSGTSKSEFLKSKKEACEKIVKLLDELRERTEKFIRSVAKKHKTVKIADDKCATWKDLAQSITDGSESPRYSQKYQAQSLSEKSILPYLKKVLEEFGDFESKIQGGLSSIDEQIRVATEEDETRNEQSTTPLDF